MKKSSSKAKLVVVDDDSHICRLIERVARPFNTTVESIVQLDDSTEMKGISEADLILLDLGMPGLDGIEVLRRLAEQGTVAKIILISGAASGVLDSASRLGRELDLHMGMPISKPFDLDDLRLLFQSVGQAKSAPEAPTSEDLQAALERGEIVPHYQPKMDLRTGVMSGVEALARWDSSEFGSIRPDVFIPLAEQGQLMESLTRSICRAAFADLSVLSERKPGIGLSLNLSPSQLTDLSYPDLMYDWAVEAAISPDQVTLEITESEAMREPTRYMDILIRFRLKGFHLSVDDFGTGFSSLDHLYQLPFEELKIDKTFVNDLGTREGATVIVKTMVALAKGLGMSTVAEGIENLATKNLLLEFGCSEGQGFYFAPALPLEGLLQRMAEEESPAPGESEPGPLKTNFELEPRGSVAPSKRAS
jgi:EAL domain-containing protein (putative c-di-GMP-specific phosphodiesterase class I)/CheY-like chemotaxis protein